MASPRGGLLIQKDLSPLHNDRGFLLTAAPVQSSEGRGIFPPYLW